MCVNTSICNRRLVPSAHACRTACSVPSCAPPSSINSDAFETPLKKRNVRRVREKKVIEHTCAHHVCDCKYYFTALPFTKKMQTTSPAAVWFHRAKYSAIIKARTRLPLNRSDPNRGLSLSKNKIFFSKSSLETAAKCRSK